MAALGRQPSTLSVCGIRNRLTAPDRIIRFFFVLLASLLIVGVDMASLIYKADRLARDKAKGLSSGLRLSQPTLLFGLCGFMLRFSFAVVVLFSRSYCSEGFSLHHHLHLILVRSRH